LVYAELLAGFKKMFSRTPGQASVTVVGSQNNMELSIVQRHVVIQRSNQRQQVSSLINSL